MSETKSIIEKAKQLFDAVKSKFDDADEVAETVETAETTEEVEAEFAEVTLLDGETVLSYEGELAPGTAIFVVADGEQVPAPEGTHALGGEFEGVSIVVDADGMISEVIDEREAEGEEAPEAETEEAMSSEDVEGIVDEKLSAYNEALNTAIDSIERLLSLKEEFEAFKSEFNEFKDKPSDEEKTNKKFSRVDEVEEVMTPAQRRLLNQRKNK